MRPMRRTVRSGRCPVVVLTGAAGSLAGVDEQLARAGVRVLRLRALDLRPVPPVRWLPGVLDRPMPDAVLVTSREAVVAGIRVWRRAIRRSDDSVEYWGVGPHTAAALRRAGARRVRTAEPPSGAGLLRRFGGPPPRRILYLRSDRAGPGLARGFRGRGHRVVERVVYRVRPAGGSSAREGRALRGADLVVATSPSAIEVVARRAGRSGSPRWARTVRLVVLGERSRRRAIELGFRRIRRVPASDAQRFTGRLLRELRDARY